MAARREFRVFAVLLRRFGALSLLLVDGQRYSSVASHGALSVH